MRAIWIGAVLFVVLAGGCGRAEKEEKPVTKNPDTKTINITVLSTKGCVNTPPAKKLIEETAAELGVNIEMTSRIISTREEANQFKFHGSPTILVNGLDLDPAMRDNTTYGFA